VFGVVRLGLTSGRKDTRRNIKPRSGQQAATAEVLEAVTSWFENKRLLVKPLS
jgi:hypothetical protein